MDQKISSPKAWLAGLLVTLCIPATLLSQEQEESESARRRLVQDTVADTTASEPRPQRRAPRRARPSPWNTSAALGLVYDSNPGRDTDTEEGSTGWALGGDIAYTPSWLPATLSYGATQYEYQNFDRWDRLYQRLELEYQRAIAPDWTVDVSAGGALSLLTLEYRIADQYWLEPRLTYQPNRTHRLSVYAAHRQRWYDDEERSDAWSPYAGASYRYRWGSWHYLDLWYRAEMVRAEVERRSYARNSATARLTYPLNRNNRLRGGVRLQLVDYEHQFATLRPEETREDFRGTVGLEWIRDLGGPWRADIGYEFQNRDSNVQERDFQNHRLEATLRYQIR